MGVRAGSVLEDDDQRGIAHLIEHLALRGTKHFPNGELLKFMQSVGSDLGPHVNGATEFDATTYRLSLPSDPMISISKGLQILRDWATDVDFSPAAVDKERQIVTEEWRLGLGAKQRLKEKALPILFKDSRYADRLPIGKKEIIEKASIATIQRFYHDWYTPENLIIVVVGDIDPRSIEDHLTQLFSDLPAHEPTRYPPSSYIPENKVWSFAVATDPEFGFEVARIVYPHQNAPLETISDFRVAAVREIALSGLTARLTEAKDREPAPYQTADASFGHMASLSRSETILFALLSDGAAERGITTLLEEAERARRWGLSEAELAREKLNWLKRIDNDYQERDKRDSDAIANDCLGRAIRHEALTSLEWAQAEAQAIASTLTLQEVNDALRAQLTCEGPIVWLSLPDKKEIVPPSEETLQKIVAAVANEKLEPYRENPEAKSILPALPAPGKIAKQSEQSAIGITEYHLANGVRVVLKPSDFKKDEIVFTALRPGGLGAFPADLDLASKCLPGYVSEAGLGAHSKIELQKLLAGKRVGWAFSPDMNFDQIKGQSSAADLETLLQLIFLAFGEARKDEGAYQRLLAANRTFENTIALDPTASFMNDVLIERYGGNPRAPRLIQDPAAWQTLTLEKILQAYRQQFGSARGYTFIFCGSFSLEQMKPLVERYLASLPSASAEPKITDIGVREIKGPYSKNFTRGSDPKAMFVAMDEIPTPWEIVESHRAWSLGNILQRTLIDRVRIEQGNSYVLQVSSKLEKYPYQHYVLEIVTPCAPESIAKVEATIKAEVDRIRTQGPNADEVSKEIESQKQALDRQARSNGDWQWKLELIYKFNEGFGRLEKPDEMLAWVTVDALRATAQKLWSTDRWIEFTYTPVVSASAKPGAM